MMGKWYPIYKSKDKFDKLDLKRCPIAEIQDWDLEKTKKKITMKPFKDIVEDYSGFKVTLAFWPKHFSWFPIKYKFKGWWLDDKDSIEGSMWSGFLPVPMSTKDFNNMQVVATDYDNYAIIYFCNESNKGTSMAAKKGETIWVLGKQPGGDPTTMPKDAQEKLTSDFNNLFGSTEDQPEGLREYKWGSTKEKDDLKEHFVRMNHKECVEKGYPTPVKGLEPKQVKGKK